MNKNDLDPKIDEVRYGDILSELIGESKILAYYAVHDYQGLLKVAWLDNTREDKYYFYEYNYGSCSGCDDWEARELSRIEIAKEMINGMVCFNNKNDFIDFMNKYKDEDLKRFYNDL